MPAPIDITSRPHQSGQQPKSNLTSQLRAAGAGMAVPMNESYGARSGSITHGNALPMSNPRLRRESMANGDLARSLLNNGGGTSWGGVSVGSWIKDDIIMTGTSPFAFQSPSYHSSSYLPKLEAEFCRDFSCCGLPLPSLHDLLRHYEEHHAQQIPMNNEIINHDHGAHDVNRQQPRHTQPQSSGITSPIGGVSGIHFEMMRQQQIQRQRQQQQQQQHHHYQDEERGGNQDDHADGEVAGDMEMDDEEMTPPPANNSSVPMSPRSHLGQHFSHPPTPTTHSHPSYHNTPNLVHSQLPQLAIQPSHFSPDSSVPGSPLSPEQMEYNFPQNMTGFTSQQQTPLSSMLLNYANNVGSNGTASGVEPTGDLSLDLCIDEPAKRLYNPGGRSAGAYSQAQLHHFLNNGGDKRQGEGDGLTMPGGLMQAEDKPFKCPVIGCEKAYKNQNGLKYHKAHGHTNQQLHDNSDGTFSIVNPETSTPYPGTLGMEKEKPYRCDYCGKRYKNLNGLKYHRAHSTHPGGSVHGGPVPGGVVAVAGGIGET